MLILGPLLLLVILAPFLAHLFLDLQVTRTEAHRDTFDKATSMLLFPQSIMENHLQQALNSQFGALTVENRQHAFGTFPPAVPDSINNILDAPGEQTLNFGDRFEVDLFSDGFPNAMVEGWEYVVHRPRTQGVQDMHFMSYGGIVRSPWTWLGWPWVTSQDMIIEPKKMQDWQGDQSQVDEDMRERLKLAE